MSDKKPTGKGPKSTKIIPIWWIYVVIGGLILSFQFFEMFNIKNIKCQKSTILFNECQEIRQNFSMTSFFSYSHPFTHIFFDHSSSFKNKLFILNV